MVPTLVVLLLLWAAFVAAAPPGDRERPLRDAVWAGRWLEGVRLYSQLEATGAEPSAQAAYLAGLAQWKLRRPEDAQPLLKKAAEAGFRAAGGRPQPDELLAKIDAYFELRPVRIKVPSLDASPLEVYSEASTPLTAPILDALPRFAETGRRLFGSAPPVRFFLFARLPRFERFYALFAETRDKPAESAHSTGVVNMVIFCEEKAHRATTAETVSLALHELMHAWVATYLLEQYDHRIPLPPYVDEGLATYVACLSSPQAAALPAERFTKWRSSGSPAPPLEALRTQDGFYAPGRAASHYWLAEQLIERLIGPPATGAAKIQPFLDAFAQAGDDLRAWRAVSDKDVTTEYAALLGGR